MTEVYFDKPDDWIQEVSEAGTAQMVADGNFVRFEIEDAQQFDDQDRALGYATTLTGGVKLKIGEVWTTSQVFAGEDRAADADKAKAKWIAELRAKVQGTELDYRSGRYLP